MPRLLAAAALLPLLVACGGMRALGGRSGSELTYAQVQTIQPGLTAAQIVDAFGAAGRAQRGPDGKVLVLDYAALDAQNGHQRLVLGFDASERLIEKRFSGGTLKP